MAGAQQLYAQFMSGMASGAPGGASGGGGAPSQPAAPEPLKVEPPEQRKLERSAVVVFGGTNWGNMGSVKGAPPDETPNLMGPHRLLAGFGSVQVSFVTTGCTSAHCVAIGEGVAFAWGRNHEGQLGLGDLTHRAAPTQVALPNPVVSAATGKAHTLFVGAGGELFAAGASKQGAVGPAASKKGTFEAKPVAVAGLPPVASVACGTNFNLVRDTTGGVWAFGWSEHGVLGNGTDGQFNTSASSIKLSYEAQATPKPVLKFKGKTMVQVACGAAHCAAVEDDGTCYTWGNGGYGRLGHKDQQDKWVPSALSELKATRVACGSCYTAATGHQVLRNGIVCTGQTSFFMWGRCKAASQDAWMYPKTEDDLRGWNVHTFGCGAAHNVVSADDSLIAFGSGCAQGELGFGEGDKKSSAAPKKVDSLEGTKVAQVACGIAHTLLLADGASPAVAALPEWVPKQEAFPAAAADEGKGKGKGAADSKKRAGAAGGSKAPKKGKK